RGLPARRHHYFAVPATSSPCEVERGRRHLGVHPATAAARTVDTHAPGIVATSRRMDLVDAAPRQSAWCILVVFPQGAPGSRADLEAIGWDRSRLGHG